MSSRTDRVALVLTVDAYKFSTRARKAALMYRHVFEVAFLGLARSGRVGRWDEPGTFERDGLRITQLDVPEPWTAPTRLNQVRNLLRCYIPALIRLVVITWRTPSSVVHVTGVHLAIAGILHRVRYKSTIVLDITERPGMVSARGSVTSIFSKVEVLVLKRVARHVQIVTVVTHGDLEAMRSLGFEQVLLVRNAPNRLWLAPYRPPARRSPGTMTVTAIGSIFEGRGYELLLHAIARTAGRAEVFAALAGPGRDDYLQSLQELADELGIAENVDWLGPIDASQVSSSYLKADIGLVLYEASDAGNDGLSNKLMECVASGRAVIAGDLPENRRFVKENAVGWLMDLSAEALADVMVDVSRAENLDDVSRRCRALGDSWLNWESEFAKVLRLLRGPADVRGDGGARALPGPLPGDV